MAVFVKYEAEAKTAVAAAIDIAIQTVINQEK
jgi:hypothetical protein